jgi:hypothetical protein
MGAMGFVVLRRFRSAEEGSAKTFRDEAAARAAAERWREEGWVVSIVPTGKRGGKPAGLAGRIRQLIHPGAREYSQNE